MSVNSKDKGARFERWVADYFTQEGYVCHRSAQYCGNTGDAPDVTGLPYLHVECKAYHDTEWDPKWIAQAYRDAKKDNIPVVIHKTDYHKPKVTMSGKDYVSMMSAFMDSYLGDPSEILVSMDLDTFTRIYREYEATRYLMEGGYER